MAKQETFKVSRKGTQPVIVSWEKPESVEDPKWGALGVDKAAINELACQSIVIKIQGVARDSLDGGQEAVQKAVNEYKYGQRSSSGGGRKAVSLAPEAVKKAKFTPEQLEMLKAAGVSIPEAA